jgi:hypothetical protein
VTDRAVAKRTCSMEAVWQQGEVTTPDQVRRSIGSR